MRKDENFMRIVATYSLVAFDAPSQTWAVGVQSKFLAVGSVVPHAMAQVGAIATQAWANPTFGPNGLKLLQQGLPAEDVVQTLIQADEGRAHRQLGIVDRSGHSAAWTGEACMEWAGHVTGPGFSCQGNILAGQSVVHDMAQTFQSQLEGDLAQKVLRGLFAAEQAGGDRRGRQSAALLVVQAGQGYNSLTDRYIDLRVDDHPQPLDELQRLLRLHRLYMEKPSPQRIKPASTFNSDAIVEGLRNLGALPPGHRQFDSQAREALKSWAHRENFEERWIDFDQFDEELIAFLLEQAATAKARGG